MDWIVVGLPTTLLALQPNEKLIKGNFFANILKRCLPASLTFIATTLAIYALHSYDVEFIPQDQLGTLVTITYTFGGLFALFYTCQPFNKWKIAMYVGIWSIVVVSVSVSAIYTFLDYATLGREQLLLLLVEILATPFVMYAFVQLFQHIKNPFKGKLSGIKKIQKSNKDK